MRTRFEIDNRVMHSANAVATIIADHNGEITIHVSKSRFTGNTEIPIRTTDRAEFARELVKILFGDPIEMHEEDRKVFTKEDLNF